jgi:pimeloyl-ACP methyl ester carboxylesterase
VRPLRNAVVGTFLSNPRFTRRFLQAFIANKSAATSERVAIYQRPLVVAGTTAAFGQWLPELLNPQTASPSQDPSAYSSLRMPVVILWGDLDTITPLAQAKRLESLVPHARLEVLGGVGHIPQIEAPEAFNVVLLRLIAQIDAPTDRLSPSAQALASSASIAEAAP